MNDDKKSTEQSDNSKEQSKQQEPLPSNNPFKPDDDKQLTQDIYLLW